MLGSRHNVQQACLAGIAVVAVVACGGCATLAHGTHQTVLVQSEPSGATLSVDGRPAGATPTRVRLSRRHRPQLTLSKDGYQTRDLRLERRASRWLFADVAIVANPLQVQGWDSADDWPQHVGATLASTVGIDLLTGGAFVFPSSVRIELVPLP